MTTVKTNEGHMDTDYLPVSAQDVVTLGYALDVLFQTTFTPVNIESTSMPEAVTSSLYTFTPVWSGQPAPTWGLSIQPPTINANINANTGETIFSAPAAAGEFLFTYVADNGLPDTVTLTLSVIAAAVNATITSTVIEDMFVGQSPEGTCLSLQVAGTGPYYFRFPATLVAGLSALPNPFDDPGLGIAFGSPLSATSGSSMDILVWGATSVTSTATFALGLRVFQFPGFTTQSLPSISTGAALTAANNIVFTGDPLPSLSVVGAASGHTWSKDGVATGSTTFANAGTYIISANIQSVCGQFGTQSATIALTMEVSLAYPPGTTYAWTPEFGKVLSGTSCSGWTSIVGGLTFDTQGYSVATTTSAMPLTWDASAGSLLNSNIAGSNKRLGHNTFAFDVPYRFGFNFKPPTDITDGTVHYLWCDGDTVPACQYVDNGAATHQMRVVLSNGNAQTSANNVSRGAFNTVQFGASDATNGFVRINGTETSFSMTAAVAWSKFLMFFGSTAEKGFEFKRMIMGSGSVTDAAHIDAWLANSIGTVNSGSNIGAGSLQITYPVSGATPAGGVFYVKCSVNTTTTPTTIDIYDNGVRRYQYPGSAAATYKHYLHHANPGTHILQAVARTTQGDVSSTAVTVSCAAQTSGSLTAALFIGEKFSGLGGVTGRKRASITTGEWADVLSTSSIAGYQFIIEWPDYHLGNGNFTSEPIVSNIDYVWNNFSKYTLLDLFPTNLFNGTNAVPGYISAGSTTTYGPCYKSSAIIANIAGASQITTGGVNAGATGSAPHYWFTNSAGSMAVMVEWRKWIDNLKTFLMPGNVRRPGFYGFVFGESSFPLVYANPVDASQLNAYGGNIGYGAGAQKLYYDMMKYVNDQFPGVPVFPAYNYQGGGSDLALSAAMANARSAGFIWSGIRNWYRPKVAPYQNTGQYSITIAQQYGAFWPATEANVCACIEADDGQAYNGGAGIRNRIAGAWSDWATIAACSLGIRTICWTITDNGTYPAGGSIKGTIEWSVSNIMRSRLTLPDFLVTGPG